MGSINQGHLIDKNVTVKTYPSIEHGGLKPVSSIVLHRTDSVSASTTLNAYKNRQKTGAHFLIDKDGSIYQTASLNKMCWHVGMLLPRCEVEKNCDQKELKTITALIHEKGLSFSKRAKNLSSHEVEKTYPLRYPANDDSIGIEVVGKFLVTEKSFEKPTQQQFNSLKCLTNTLIKEYNLELMKDVYAHGAIARKEKTEGAQLLQYLFSGPAHE